MANKEARKTTVEKPKKISKAEKIQHDNDNSTLFCIGDDDYKDNVFYVIGKNEKELYYHTMKKYGVIHTSEIGLAMNFEHFTDAETHRRGMPGEEEYKVFKVVCEIRMCDNQ